MREGEEGKERENPETKKRSGIARAEIDSETEGGGTEKLRDKTKDKQTQRQRGRGRQTAPVCMHATQDHKSYITSKPQPSPEHEPGEVVSFILKGLKYNDIPEPNTGLRR